MTEQTDTTRRQLPLASAAASGCACCAPATPSTDGATAQVAPSAPAPAATYRVEGMTCGHCAGRVTDAITALDGVADVRVDLAAGGTSDVVVTGPADARAVRNAVEQAGYTVVS
ncbi:MAG: hypothetical protein MOP51_2845 [Citricoccus sp.]|nr:hypothetical protein [Citricoccus sp. WCRC_4]